MKKLAIAASKIDITPHSVCDKCQIASGLCAVWCLMSLLTLYKYLIIRVIVRAW